MKRTGRSWWYSVAVALLLVTSPHVSAQRSSAGAVFPHPFQNVGSVDQPALKAATARVMEMEDARIVQLISEKVPIRVVGCPDLEGGAQDTGAEVWSIDDPWRVKCRYTDQWYPSERYPLNGEIRMVSPRGQTQSYRYYDGGSEKRRYFFEGAATAGIDDYFAGQAYDLARLYWATKDEKYAHKAAAILDRFAQVYPSWPVHGNEGNYANWKTFYTAPPYPVESGKWGRWIHDELCTELALAYDLIYNSGVFVELSQRNGIDVRKRIENDLFRAQVELVRSYPRYVGPSGMNGTAAGLIAIGRAIEEPNYVHDGVSRFKDSFSEWFFPDGMLHTGSPGYHLQMLAALPDPAQMARGYSDPRGYTHPGDELRFEDLSLEGSSPMFDKARNTVRRLLMPDGRYAPIHDSWGRNRFTQDTPPLASVSTLLPAYGHAVLARGAEANQIQAHLHFGYHAGHAHADELNLMLFAHGKELLSDIGYTHTKLRPWATSTLSHNTVVVDRLNQALTQGWVPASWTHLDRFDTTKSEAKEPVFGNLLLYDVAHDHVQVVEAEASRAYREQVPGLEEYRRLIALVGVSRADAYVVDVFRVRGGKGHLWAVHGSADEVQEVETDLRLQPQEGTLLGPGTRYSASRDPELDSESFKGAIFGLLDGLSTGSTDRLWSAIWRYRDGAAPGLKLTMLGGQQRKITLAQAPSVRPAKEDNARVDEFKMPILLVEDGAVESTFVAIWEPFTGRPLIAQVKALEFEGEGGRAVAFAVQIGDRTDYILTDPDGTQLRKIKGMDLSFRGRFGVVSVVKGKCQFMHLAAGTLLALGPRQLQGGTLPQGEILSFRREEGAEGFETDSELPLGEVLHNRLLLISHPDGRTQGYTIRKVKRQGNRTLVTIEGESGLAVSAGSSTYVPTFGVPAPPQVPAKQSSGQPIYRQTYFPHTEFKQGLGSFLVLTYLCASEGRQEKAALQVSRQ